MVQEDQIQRSSYSSGGGSINSRSSSKKPKQRKTPQRGLGVAQLEKIRIEEQLKKDVAAITSASILSSPSSMSSSYPTLPNLSHPHSNQSLSSSSFLSASQANFSLSNSIMRAPFPTLNVDSKNSISLSLVNQASHCGFEAMWAGMSMLGRDDTSKMLKSCEYNVESGNYGADPGLSCQSNTLNPYQSHFSCPPIQITQQYQPSSASVVDISSTSSTLSLLNFQMEPPSNQIYYCNYPTTVWPEEEKIGGMKRPYPFYLDDPPGISSNHRSRTSVRMRSDESLCENGGSNRSSKLRDSRSNSTCAMAQNRKKCFLENNFTQDFLALTPSAHPGSHYNELHDFKSLPFQKDSEEVSAIRLARIGLSHRQQFCSFFPPADATHISHATNERNGETGESVDLSLKL